MGRPSKDQVKKAVTNVERLIKDGMSITKACKEAGTTVTTYNKYTNPTKRDADRPTITLQRKRLTKVWTTNPLDAAVDYLIENESMSTSAKRDTIKTIYTTI